MSLIFSQLKENNFDGVLRLIKINKNCIYEKNENDLGPIFFCLNSYDITKIIIEYDTNCLNCTNANGNTPLHIACMMRINNSSNMRVINYLINQNPSMLYVANTLGNLPLHVAVQITREPSCWRETIELIHLMLSIYPKGANCQNNDGKLPLHYACAKNCPFEGIAALVEVCISKCCLGVILDLRIQ